MRLNTTGKGLMIGCALAVAATGCKDETTTPTDMGTADMGGNDLGTDAGSDAGMDAGEDMGVDMGTAAPVYLRVAHLAFGSGVGTVHLCAKNTTNNQYTLVTSQALFTGDFTHAVAEAPIPYGTITKHLPLTTTAQAALAGQVVEIYPVANAGATITAGIGGTSFGSCTPTGSPLASATLGVDIQLAPGESHTIAVVGAAGAEVATACGGGACPGPQIIDLLDETAPVTGSPTTARTRLVNADPRFGAAPGFCVDFYGNPSPNLQPVTPGGLAAFAGSGATLAYEDASPLPLVTGPVPDGGTDVLPRLFTLHPSGTAGTPCDATVSPIGAGILPNAALIAQFAAQAANGAATIRAGITPDINTTVFVAPQLLQWIETDPTSPNVGTPCNALSSATCLPAGGVCTTPAADCTWVPIAMPVEDLTP